MKIPTDRRLEATFRHADEKALVLRAAETIPTTGSAYARDRLLRAALSDLANDSRSDTQRLRRAVEALGAGRGRAARNRVGGRGPSGRGPVYEIVRALAEAGHALDAELAGMEAEAIPANLRERIVAARNLVATAIARAGA